MTTYRPSVLQGQADTDYWVKACAYKDGIHIVEEHMVPVTVFDFAVYSPADEAYKVMDPNPLTGVFLQNGGGT